MIEWILNKVNKKINRAYRFFFPKRPWYSFYGDVPEHLDYPDVSIYELIERTAENYPYYYALEYFGKKITYREFILKIKKCASALIEMGVKPRDRVTICMPNTPSSVIMFYAINFIGASANMVHPLSSEKELLFYLRKTGSKYMLVIDFVYDKIKRIEKDTSLERVIVSAVSVDMSNTNHLLYWFFTGRKSKIEKDDKAIFWRDFIKSGILYRDMKPYQRNYNEEAVILYSGGTTGSPKGIVLTDMNFNALAMQGHLMCDPAKAGDSILSIMPIFHGFGLGVCIHTPLYIGMKCVLIPNFSYRKFGKLIKKYRPNFIVGVPTLFESLIKSNIRDLSSVTCCVSGGDNLSLKLKKEVDAFLESKGSKTRVREGYGLTECTGAACLTPRRFYRENSIGIPFPDMIFKIVKVGTMQEVPSNVDGEICISGPTVMMGYLDNVEETRSTLRKHKDGRIYLHTGDIGSMDEQGFVYFKQRLKRMIISSGYNVYPSNIEAVLNEHPLVATSVVIGIPHPYKTQVAKAYIVLKEGYTASNSVKRSIREHCEKCLAKFSLPYEYEFRKVIPKTLIGKVNYRELERENVDTKLKE